MTYYDSPQGVSEYVWAHYAPDALFLPYTFGPKTALQFQSRVVAECVDSESLPARARALDLGCAVGRTSFELSRVASEVVGIDASESFIAAAEKMRCDGRLEVSEAVFELPKDVFPERVRFLHGDAMRLQKEWGQFNVVMMLNVIDRLPDPEKCLASLHTLMVPGAQLVVTSPYTWMESYTSRDKWIAGLDGLQKILKPQFELKKCQDIPFMIREHARKYQWSVSQASMWIRR